MTPNSLKTTQERKGKGGEGGEKKKGLLTLIIFILPTLEFLNDKKALATHRFRHLDRAASFSKIQVDIFNIIAVYMLYPFHIIACVQSPAPLRKNRRGASPVFL